MIQMITGEKGKGKTKHLLEMVSQAQKTVQGSIAYLDKSQKHMYELHQSVRLIDLSKYPIDNSDEFLGFVCGILSQDKDLEQIYFDSFLTIAHIAKEDLSRVMDRLECLSERFQVTFVLSVSQNAEDLPEELKSKIVVSL